MRTGFLCFFVAIAVVSLLAAQAPNSGSNEQSKAGKAAPADDAKDGPAESKQGRPRTGEVPRGFRGGPPPGFQPGSRGGFVPKSPPTTTRTIERSERPGFSVPPKMDPLPEGAATGKMLLLDVCFAQTEDNLTQPSAEDLLAMEREGKLKSNSRVRLLLLENQTAFAQFSEVASKVVGHTNTGLKTMPIWNSAPVGTLVQANGKVADDGNVLLRIVVEKSELEASDKPPETRQPDDISRLNIQSTVRLKPGEPMVLSSGPAVGSDAKLQTWVVLSCRPL